MNKGINILMYHQVGEFAPMKAHRSTYCDHRRFAGQMAYLARFGYTVLSMDQVLDCLRGNAAVPDKAVALTFDDGYENFYEYAFPVLHRHRFPAMVYMISDLLGKPSSWFAADGRDTPPIMSAERIRELRGLGIDFGSHGAGHLKLAQQSTELIRDDVRRSKAALEDVLGEAVLHFCYPYGSHDRRAVDAVADAGYASATTCVRSPATPADDPLTLPRKAISWGDNLLGYFWRLHMKNTPKTEPIRRSGETFADALTRA